MIDLTINYSEVVRYMGADKNDKEMLEIAKQASSDLKKALSPKYMYLKFPIKILPDFICISGTDVVLYGEDIKQHLEKCTDCYIILGTLGASTDRFLRLSSHQNMLYSLALDASSTEFTEGLMDIAENEIYFKEKANNRYITSRFSPGYGDLPITIQKDIISLCDAPRRIGLSVTDSNILTPKKSVTAIIGISDFPVNGKQRGCSSCNLISTCAFRKAGTTCGNKKVYSNK